MPIGYATDVPHTTLVTTDLLAANLSGDGKPSPAEGGWVVIDCRFDLAKETWGLEQYRQAHIPGAVYASLDRDLAGEKTGYNGRHPIPPVEALAATFSRFGIGPETQVVAYDQDTGMYASRLWWTLRYLGHDAVAVLDGGWAKWQRENRPVKSGDETNVASPFRARPRDEMRLAVADVERLVGARGVMLVDARGPERFEGQSEPLDRVAGHIPGAVNHFYKQNISAEGTMLPGDTLKQKFDALLKGCAPADVVMYCGSGVSACHNLLAMEHAGITGVRLYPGSWSEWSADQKRPIETGPARR
jgi:thiosulfate/3-mercaptopyruvate sulfurtransferase